ncbi:ChaN family lipoprotein [uncultured Roseobacter sp.]|uniref:ChaN family lipoprotein n=1 Tax=uncultured Roseobacter sp. TaxID=114847 RepID=UPI0026321CD8|nr:ChaN family lipoprotein [uncultured Roseobacter sp.]
MRTTAVMMSFGAAAIAASSVFADSAVPPPAFSADVVFLGEQHDNPAHHRVQAEWTAEISPAALVFEMLTPEQAARITPENRRSQSDLAVVLEWEAAGWPDFAMYFPIFAAAETAAIYGAGVPRDQVRGLMGQHLTAVFGAEDAARFGLDQPLPEDEQQAREALQADAHCDALPEEMLPLMVSVQRLRDAALARAALEARSETGGTVVVITGNGHARSDWGAPALLQAAAPDLVVFALGQGEAGQAPAGGFDTVVDGESVDRGNPCDAFN